MPASRTGAKEETCPPNRHRCGTRFLFRACSGLQQVRNGQICRRVSGRWSIRRTPRPWWQPCARHSSAFQTKSWYNFAVPAGPSTISAAASPNSSPVLTGCMPLLRCCAPYTRDCPILCRALRVPGPGLLRCSPSSMPTPPYSRCLPATPTGSSGSTTCFTVLRRCAGCPANMGRRRISPQTFSTRCSPLLWMSPRTDRQSR